MIQDAKIVTCDNKECKEWVTIPVLVNGDMSQVYIDLIQVYHWLVMAPDQYRNVKKTFCVVHANELRGKK